jgi:hypothetical protein
MEENMNSKHSIALVIGALFVLVACSSRPAYAAPDPCSLLTQAQVSAALGVEVGAGRLVVPKLCEWTAAGQSTAGAKRLLVTLQDPRTFVYAQMQVGHGITKTPVSGVGDEAVSGTTPGLATVLTVKKGNVVFVVHIFGLPNDQTKEKEKTLALEILSKL